MFPHIAINISRNLKILSKYFIHESPKLSGATFSLTSPTSCQCSTQAAILSSIAGRSPSKYNHESFFTQFYTRTLNGFLFLLLAHFFCIHHHNSAYSPQDEKFRRILWHRLNLENLNICSASGSNITGPSYQRKHQHQYQQKHHHQQKH